MARTTRPDRRFQLRRDLQFSEYSIGLNPQWVVKDPVKLEYYMFESFERLLLDLLRRPMTANELKQEADKVTPSGNAPMRDIESFLKRLLNDNLLVANGAGFGTMLWSGHQQKQKNARMQALFGVLAIRFRGIDPQRMLDMLNPFTRHLFQPAFLLMAVCLFGFALIAAMLNAHLILESSFLWGSLKEPTTLLLIAGAVMTVKVLHEFGHALACRSIERSCHEMGVLLLAFIPCLYCNVSDIWMEPNRWKRMLVAAAGIYVEMMIAVVCVPLWLFSVEGPLQVFWFAMLTICSVNTILINGNPLLRYDGYYLLSDWLNIPNLYGESQKRVDRRIQSLFFAGAIQSDWSFLDLYGMLSRVYRTIILGVILFAIYSFFAKIELPSLGILITGILATITFGGMLFANVRKAQKYDWGQLRLIRSAGLFGTLIILCLGLMFLPVTTRIFAEGDVGIRGDGVIYSPDNGQIFWNYKAAENVSAGDVLGHVKNVDLELSIFEQRQQIRELEFSIANLEIIRRHSESDMSSEIELSRFSLNSARETLSQLEKQLIGLNILARSSGILQVLPQSKVHQGKSFDLQRTDSTLLPENEAAFVQSGEPVAILMNPQQQLLQLHVPEKRIRHVDIGQQVKFLVGSYSPSYGFGVVETISHEQTESPEFESSKRWIEEGYVRVQVRLNSAIDDLIYGSNATAVIIAGQRPIYRVILDALSENFDF